MDICGKHEGAEIAYEGKKCPACLQVNMLTDRIEGLTAEIEKLNADVEDLLEEKA